MQADGLILAGGKSTRMGGRHKGELLFREQTFLERIIEEIKQEAETVWISYGALIRREYPGCQIVQDEYPDCGPIGGFHAGFKRSRNDLILTAACDMPFLKIELYDHLYEMLEWEGKRRGISYAGAVPVIDKNPHPLTAIYRKELAGSLEQQIQKGDFRLQAWLQGQDMLYLDVTDQPWYRKMLRNINSLAEYQALLLHGELDGERGNGYAFDRAPKGTGEKGAGAVGRQRIVAVCGIKDSGKTTLLVRLVKALTKRGFKVAVIKHDGHAFTCDIPGTDSYRFWEAGACGTAVYSRDQTFIRRSGPPEEKELLKQFPDADLLFIEGQKGSRYPKIEVIRRAAGGSGQPVSDPEGRFLLVTDWDPGHFTEPAVGFDDLEEIIRRIFERIA